ncbi:MAG: hypothetical protein WED33_03655 [Bacteroidia bacterium]
MKNLLIIIFVFSVELTFSQVVKPAFEGTIREFEVFEKMRPETVISSPQWMIKDFIFQGEDLLLLTWDKNPKKCFLRRMDAKNNELASIPMNDEALGFFEDVFHQVFLETRESVFYVSSIPGIHLEKINEEVFYSLIRTTVAKSDSSLISSTWHPKTPEFQYLIKNNGVLDTLSEIRNKHLYDLYYSEYRFLPFSVQCSVKRRCRETGESKYDVAAHVTGFTESLWWHELYSPLINIRDSFYLADHYQDSLFVFDLNGKKIRSTEIDFHKAKGYDQEVLYDEFTTTWYARNFRNGVTRLIPLDFLGNQSGEPIVLTYKYVEKIKLHQGKAYYLYRPFESLQNTFIYSELLPARVAMADNQSK